MQNKSRGTSIPKVTLCLIALNFAVWIGLAVLSADPNIVNHTWGLVPARFLADIASGDPLRCTVACITPFTSLFLHAPGWDHVTFNMVAFLIFAPAVERKLGDIRFLTLYLLTGLVANAFYVTMVSDGKFDSIGASAAVCGIMGAFLLLFLKTKWLRCLLAAAILALTVRGILNADVIAATGFTGWMHLTGYAAGAIIAGIMTVGVPKQERRVP